MLLMRGSWKQRRTGSDQPSRQNGQSIIRVIFNLTIYFVEKCRLRFINFFLFTYYHSLNIIRKLMYYTGLYYPIESYVCGFFY